MIKHCALFILNFLLLTAPQKNQMAENGFQAEFSGSLTLFLFVFVSKIPNFGQFGPKHCSYKNLSLFQDATNFFKKSLMKSPKGGGPCRREGKFTLLGGSGLRLWHGRWKKYLMGMWNKIFDMVGGKNVRQFRWKKYLAL